MPGEAEIYDDRRPVGPHPNVARLEVAVDDALFLKGRQPVAKRLEERRRLLRRPSLADRKRL